jgi:hypothetical protein
VAPDLVLLSRVSFRDQEIVGPRLQALIALLAGELRTGCGAGRLIEGIWPDRRPENPAKALQILVSRARSQLGADLIVRTPTGYRLALADDQVDSSAVLLRAEADLADALPGSLIRLLTQPPADSPPYPIEQLSCGTLLLAIAVADLARARRTGDPDLARSAARMIALAERFRFLRMFQPTMSAASARAEAEQADRPAYEKAVLSYAGLDRAGIRAAARDLVRDRAAGADQRVRSRL